MRPEAKTLSIAAVERETGLSKDTLRVWERRYDFPRPDRDDTGERCYPADQVEKLRVLRILLDRGLRPGKLIGLELEALQAMVETAACTGPGETGDGIEQIVRPDLMEMVEMCRNHRLEELRAALSQSLMRMGMFRFVADVVAPLTSLIGRAWAAGALAVFEEHLFTEALQAVLRNAIAALPPPPADALPRVLLTTVPGEEHGLGLLMTEAILTMEGARCVPLGVQTPVSEIARAARAQHIDIVALSFSTNMRAAQVRESLADLRDALGGEVQVWAGGGSPALRRPPADILVLDLPQLGDALAHWRGQAAAIAK